MISPHSMSCYSSGDDEQTPKVRKPYTITKQRERWTEAEHDKFLEALKLHGRAWQKIKEHIGTKTAVQIRSHAQKFFTKVARETASNEASSLNNIEIPPPRPKRKPKHPYPRKPAKVSKKEMTVLQAENKSPPISSPLSSNAIVSSITPQGLASPLSSSSSVTVQLDLIDQPNQMNCDLPDSSVGGSGVFGPETGFLSSSSSTDDLNLRGPFVFQDSQSLSSGTEKSTWLDRPLMISDVDSSTCNTREMSHSVETDPCSSMKEPSAKTSSMCLKLFGQTVFVSPASLMAQNMENTSYSKFEKEDSPDSIATNETIPIQMEAHFRYHPLKPVENACYLEPPKVRFCSSWVTHGEITKESNNYIGDQTHEDCESSSSLFSRKVSLSGNTIGFVPYRRCRAETDKDDKPQFHRERPWD